MAKFEQAFSFPPGTGNLPTNDDLRLAMTAVCKSLDEVGMVYVSGRTQANWGAAPDPNEDGDEHTIYKFPDFDNDKIKENLFIKVWPYIAPSSHVYQPYRFALGVEASFNQGFNAKILFKTRSPSSAASNPYKAVASYSNSVLTFGIEPGNSNYSNLFSVERFRARTAGQPNDDGVLVCSYSFEGHGTGASGVFKRFQAKFAYRDPYKEWTSNFQAGSWWRGMASIGPVVANGVAHCQPYFFYNKGVLEQSHGFLEIPSSVTRATTVEVENGIHSSTVRTPARVDGNTPGYVWAYRWQ